MLPHAYRTLGGKPGGTGGTPAQYEQVKVGLALYDLEKDLGETTNVADQHPEVVKRLEALIEQCRERKAGSECPILDVLDREE